MNTVLIVTSAPLCNQQPNQIKAASNNLYLITKKGRQLNMLPNRKMQTIVTQQALEQIGLSGRAELKAHRFFEGVWKECRAVIDYLEKYRKSGKDSSLQ